MQYYTIKINNLSRLLPIVPLGPKLKIASLNILGDVELVKVCARLLYQKIKALEFDYLVGPEVKIVPLLHELSAMCGKTSYIVCRKKIHGYMVKPITTATNPSLTINGVDAEIIKNKKVLVIDDVVSTGRTLATVKKLMDRCQAETIGFAAIAKQGENPFPLSQNFFYLITLPLFREG